MKRLFIYLLFLSLPLSAQRLSCLDLCTIFETHELNLINNLLVNNKGFIYGGIVYQNKEGHDVHKFSHGINYVEVSLFTMEDKGKFYDITRVFYYVYDQDPFDFFLNSLAPAGFKKTGEGTPDNTDITKYFWMYGTDYPMHGLVISQRTNHYVIEIII